MMDTESQALDEADEQAVEARDYLIRYCRGQGCDTCVLGDEEYCCFRRGGCPREWRDAGRPYTDEEMLAYTE